MAYEKTLMMSKQRQINIKKIHDYLIGNKSKYKTNKKITILPI